ncbi:class I SAM-dependent methyltransferase [Thalassotalea sp. PS06]|uniref:class I SAM-dependent methyltransferase n=1 Tax=Thalassotalea sp. PS06 TaxID=2594005 RepID=UPI001162F980|nr:methyltransferase domain-containing protein [Thalassotalea sp. PS06]QDP01410.1 methyltransferase domain-containing protein [Thalassotalea sp. PS06]
MQHWDAYWKCGFVTSFGNAFSDNYEGAFLDFWHSTFSSLPKKSNVLDIATGNASLPLIGINISHDLQLEHTFTGTDLASVDVSLIESKLQDLPDYTKDAFNILPGVCSTKLPFADQSFDCVTSQYGFEYSNQAKTIEQISRVCKVDGEVVLVTHHAESVILQRNNKTIQLLNKILSNSGLLSIITKLVKQLGDGAPLHDDKSEKLRNKLNQKIRSLEAEDKTSYFDTNVQDLISGLFQKGSGLPAKTKLAKIEEFKIEARAHLQRLADLKKAALNSKNLELLEAQAKQAGLVLHSIEELIGDKNNLLAWIVKFKKVS